MTKNIALYVCLQFSLCAITFAQSQGTGSITGTVRDSADLTISNADVTATNTGTGLERRATTDSLGTFNMPVLPTGTYDVKIAAAGFTPLETRGVVVNVGAVATVTGQLAVDAVQ